MSNEHVARPFADIVNDIVKPHLQNQRPAPRHTNRDRFDALLEGWKATCLDGVEAISFGTFQAGVEEFEKVLAERSLDRQYDYERSRS